MAAPQQSESGIRELRPVEGSARELLRYVDRAELDELTQEFVAAVGLPAMVLASSGEFIAGSAARCPACDDEANGDHPFRLKGWNADSGWVRCAHGPRHLAIPIMGRGGVPLGVVAVGPLAVSEADLSLLRRALIAAGATERQARIRASRIGRCAPEQVEAAARLLARTFDIVVREAAIASESADLVASERHTNRELTVLYSVVRALSSGTEEQAILQGLVDALVSLLGCDVALVGLVEGNDLVTAASSGLLTLEAKHGRLKVGEGLAGRVAATGESLSCRDMQDDPRQYLTAINSREQLHAFAGVPLSLRDGTVGVLAVYRRVPYAVPDSELRLLEHIAAQVVVAMERARLYEQERRTIGELQALHERTERHHRALERANAVQHRLTQMVLQDAGLDAIVDTLAGLLESDVCVVDRFHQVLARAPRPAGQLTPDETDISLIPAALADEDLRQIHETLREQRRPVLLPADPALGFPHPRVIAAVVAGEDLLGYLSVTERDRPLDDSDLLALGHASTVIALEMMKQRTRAEVERRLRGELLEELVSGEFQDPAAVQRRAAYLGYNLTSPYALLYIVPAEGPRELATAPPSTSTLVEAVGHLTGAMNPGSMSLVDADGATVAIALHHGTLDEARGVAASLRTDLTATMRDPVLVAMGRVCQAPEDFAVSLGEAKRAIALARSLGATDRVVVFEDLGVYRLLLDLPRASDAARFAEDLLAPLLSYDERHDTRLLETLEAFLAANGTQQRAADMLSIHVNTLVYRLQKIRELTGVDLQDSDARLGLHLAVKIRQTIAATIGGHPQ